MEQNTNTQTPALTPEEILAAIYRNPDNEGDTTVYAMPVVLEQTADGWTVAHVVSMDGRTEETLHVRYNSLQQYYRIIVAEDK